jgi:long-chain acyl-CoA synthetase
MSPKLLPYTIADFHLRSEKNAFLIKAKGEWTKTSWPEYQKDIYKISHFLSTHTKVDFAKVGIVCNTRYEWCVTDLAAQCAKRVLVPIYPAVTPEEMSYIINHSEIEVLFLENKNQVRVWQKISQLCPSVKTVVIIDKFDLVDSPIVSWDKILEKKISPEDKRAIKNSINSIKIDTVASIVYTSGTTGNPKGVVLTHRQIISEVVEAFNSCQATAADRTLTFLPFAHVFGRIENWAHTHFGYEMAFAESMEKIKNNLVEINPTFIFAVPRIFEKIYIAVISSIENNKIKQIAFEWAINQAKKKLDKTRSFEMVPIRDWALAELAQRLILDKVKHAFGNQLRFCVSGGAPLNPAIAEFFAQCGVKILEGYGLTETTAAVAVNTPFDFQIGTVGRPIGDVQIKFAADGEILLKSDKVATEYYKDPQATAAAFEDGWFKTGDIGELTPTGHLRITDRKKDLIKTANGKYIAPQKLEGLLKLNPLIANVLIHGDQKKYVIAILSIDHQQAKKWADANDVDSSDIKRTINSPKFTDEIRHHIMKVNSELANHESIKKYQVIADEFTVENGLLTHSLKVKRKLLDQKYKDVIESLY